MGLPFDEFAAALTDPREKLAAYLTHHCGPSKCSNHFGYLKPDMRENCDCWQEAGEIIEMLRPMLKETLKGDREGG